MSCVCVLKLCSLKKKQPHISDADCDVYCGQNAIFILAKKFSLLRLFSYTEPTKGLIMYSL